MLLRPQHLLCVTALLALASGCNDLGTADYSSDEGVRDPVNPFPPLGPDPFRPGDERLTVGYYYEGGFSREIPLNGITNNYFAFSRDDTDPIPNLDYTIDTSSDRLEGYESIEITLARPPPCPLPPNPCFWGGGILWDEPIDLSEWTTMFVGFKSSDASFGSVNIVLQYQEERPPNEPIPDPLEVSLNAAEYGYRNDGEWHFLEIPLQDAIDLGFDPKFTRSPFIVSGNGIRRGDQMLIDNLYFTKVPPPGGGTGGTGGAGGTGGTGGAGGSGGTGGSGTIPLPMVVDDHYFDRSAFGDGGPPLHTEDDLCPERAGAEEGNCHRFQWNGMGGGFTGTFWTSGSDFTDLNGLAVEGGATQVQFYAWGAAGGEEIEFGAGLDGEDVGTVRDFITLTTSPTRYSVPLTNLAGYSDVFGPFIVAVSNSSNPDGAEFYVDDIQWVEAPIAAIPLPMVVDDHYFDRSGFGPDGPSLHTEDNMCPERAGAEEGDCHRFQWNGMGGDFTGTFFTSGSDFTNLNGLLVEGGADRVQFYAWGAAGGEEILFGAGLPDAIYDNAADRRQITLTTTPTQYTVSFDELLGYSQVFGPFIFAGDNTLNPSGFVFYVDDIQWVVGN